MKEPRQIATVRSYDELLDAVRKRVDELNVSQLGLDEDCQLTRGHVSKLIGPVPVKSFGRETFGPIIQALGLMLIVVEDPATMANSDRLARKRRSNQHAHAGMLTPKRRKIRGIWLKNSAWGQILAARRIVLISPWKRSQIARKAARERWRKKALEPRIKPPKISDHPA